MAWGGDIPESAVQPDGLVMLDVTFDQAAGILERERATGTKAFGFQGLLPAFDLAVRLRVEGRSPDVRHAGEADEFLKVAGDELRPIVRDDARASLGELLFGPLQDQLDVGFGRGSPDVPGNDGAAVAIEHAREVIEGAAQIQVRNVDVPVFMKSPRRVEPTALLRRTCVPARETTDVMEHPPNASGADGDDVGVEHHKGQAAVALQGKLPLEVEDGLALHRLQPKVTGNPGVVLMDTSIALLPGVELAGSYLQPADEASGTDPGAFRPAPDEVNHLVPGVRGRPAVSQFSPRLFLRPRALPSVRPRPRSWLGASDPGQL